MLRYLDTSPRPGRPAYTRPKNLYQILAYDIPANAAGTLVDATAVPDTSFSARGGSSGAGHWIFTEPYNLMAAFAAGGTITQVQLFDSTWNAINIPQIYPVNKALAVLTNPNVMDLRHCPLPIPMNEEIAMQFTNTGAAEVNYGFIWIQPPGQAMGMDYPSASLTMPRLFAIVTTTAVLTVNTWSPFTPITFTNPIKGGAYQVNGAMWIVPTGSAYKHNFVKAPLYQGRKLFPGGLCETAYGNVPQKQGTLWLGPQGRFNNFELPQVSFFANASAGSTTYTGILDLTYLGSVGVDAQP